MRNSSVAVFDKTFSIVVTTHSRATLLARALASVTSQRGEDVQLIVVSDVLDNDTNSIVNYFLRDGDIYIRRYGSPGPAISRNIGLDNANGKYVIFLDDDDSFRDSYLADLKTAISGRQNVFFCDFDVADEDRLISPPEIKKVTEFSLAGTTRESVQVINTVPNNCLVFPRIVVENVNFDPSLQLFEDWDFLLKAIRGSELSHLPIRGPVIHKSDRSLGDRRGAVNDHLLVDTTLRIYRFNPATSIEITLARQARFKSVGLDFPISCF